MSAYPSGPRGTWLWGGVLAALPVRHGVGHQQVRSPTALVADEQLDQLIGPSGGSPGRPRKPLAGPRSTSAEGPAGARARGGGESSTFWLNVNGRARSTV